MNNINVLYVTGVKQRSITPEEKKTAVGLERLSDEEGYLGTGFIRGIHVACLPG